MTRKMNTLVKSLAMVLALSFGAQSAVAKTYISMGTNPVGMAWYTMGAALTEVLRTEAPDIAMTVEATNGAVHNVNLMAMGDIEMALTSAKEAQDAYNGEGRYKAKLPILGLYAASVAYSQCVALADSGITSIEDLKGKRIGVGVGGSSTRVDNQELLAVSGMSVKDFDAFSETLPEAVEKMKNGQLEANMWFGVSPLAPLMDLAQSRDLTWFALSKEKAEELSKKYPYYYYSELPANTYPKQDKPIPTVAQRYNMVALAEMDEEVAYQITKASVENFDKLTAIYKGWGTANREQVLQSMTIPLHPGAIKYFREINLPGLDEYIAKYPNK